MNNIIKTIGLLSLIIFSFFYSEKVMMIVNEQDKLMIELKENEEKYFIEKKEAIIKNNTIIPGIYGKKVNINKSYTEMKKIGIFNKNLLVYDMLTINNTIVKNYDKYIISGNNNKKKVAIIFILNKTELLNSLIELLNKNKIEANFFIDQLIFDNNLDILYKLSNYELYNYGNNGNYTNELIMINNNKINNIANNKSSFCLTLVENKEVLEICSKNKMNTIIPNIIDNNSNYNNIKNNIKNGSIILFELKNKTINEILNISSFITKKGYQIVPLNNLLNEKDI